MLPIRKRVESLIKNYRIFVWEDLKEHFTLLEEHFTPSGGTFPFISMLLAALGRESFGIGLSLLIAVYGMRKKALSVDGAMAGLVVGLVCCLFAGFRGAFVLLAFFLSSSKLTRFRDMIKKKIEHDFKKGGQRNAVQVISNGLVGCIFAVSFAVASSPSYSLAEVLSYRELPLDSISSLWPRVFLIGYLAHFACCNGDTWASELGIASGSAYPFLLLGVKVTGAPIVFQRVPRGTNGGMSLVGTVASIAGGLFIGLSFSMLDLALNAREGTVTLSSFLQPCLYATFAGFTGSLVRLLSYLSSVFSQRNSQIDSLLGGTLQHSLEDKKTGRILEAGSPSDPNLKHITGIGILDNHQVSSSFLHFRSNGVRSDLPKRSISSLLSSPASSPAPSTTP